MNYIKLAVILAIFSTGACAGWFADHSIMSKKISAMQAEQAEIDKQKAEEAKALTEKLQSQMQESAKQYQKRVEAANTSIENLKKELQNVAKKNPMPANCRLDSDRMRIIQEAGRRANSAATR